jgi:ubiquinone/menaquinone biosynthesis C-methylase UbiE
MDIRRLLLKIYWRLQRAIVPALHSSQQVYEEILKERIASGARWLDVGAGSRVLPDWRLQEEKELVGRARMFVALDAERAALRGHRAVACKVVGDIAGLPFRENFFDVVTANMVVEHLARPEEQFQEIFRTLRRGGLFIFHTPNVFGYTTALARLIPKGLRPKLVWLIEGRKSSEVFETHYRVNSRKAIARLARRSGFNVVVMKMISSNAEFVFVPPLALLELIWIRVISAESLEGLRTNIVGVLEKPRV